MKKISLLIPAYNEEQSLEALYDALQPLLDGSLSCKYEFEVMFINDGSIDDTLSELEQLRNRDHRINYVDLTRNFGKENAMLAGFDYVTGDCAIIMDADLQHPISAIPEMIKLWEAGYEDVYGKRASRGKESWIRKKLSLAYYNVLQKSTRIEILPNVGDFRLLDKRCVKALRKLRETQRYTKGLYCWIGFKKKEIIYEQLDGIRPSNFTLRSLFNLAMQGLTSYSTAPLRISAVAGFTVSLFAILYLIFIVIKTIFYGEDIQGFPTLMCAILFLGGVQLIAIGIIGEYIGTIFNESKNRPVYLVNSVNGEKVE